MVLHDAGDALPDAGEGDFSGAESIDCDFVGSVVDGGQGATGEAGLAGEVECREVVRARRLEFEFREAGEIEWRESALDAIWPGERVLDREAHVGAAELREDRAIDEFDHRVNDALRVHDHIDAIHADAKQPTGFDHFEALVEECG